LLQLALSEGDYSMAMKVLSENLGDIPEDTHKSVEAAVSQTTVAVSKTGQSLTFSIINFSPISCLYLK